MDSFFILHKMTLKVFKNLKILQNLGIKLESRHFTAESVPNKGGVTSEKGSRYIPNKTWGQVQIRVGFILRFYLRLGLGAKIYDHE